MGNQFSDLGLAAMINSVKNELLSVTPDDTDSTPVFGVTEITVEVNFTVTADIHGGIDLKVVQLGSRIEDQRVHKAVITLTPLLSTEQILEEAAKMSPDMLSTIAKSSTKAILKGEKDQLPVVPRT